jgi:hypothetical protein
MKYVDRKECLKNPAYPRNRVRELVLQIGGSDLNVCSCTMLGGSLVTTAWRVLRLRMEGSLPGAEGSCEYIE